jgi:hypothetical protein
VESLRRADAAGLRCPTPQLVPLAQQSHAAANDANLHSGARGAMVLRARLTRSNCWTPVKTNCSEVYLCGLLSQIDLVLGEPLTTVLAVLAGVGPHQRRSTVSPAWVGVPLSGGAVATALEYPRMNSVPASCARTRPGRDVNRCLVARKRGRAAPCAFHRGVQELTQPGFDVRALRRACGSGS